MDAEHLTRLTAAWPGVTHDMKWQDDLIFSVAGKMFCGLCLRGAAQGMLSLKVEAERFLELTDRPGFRLTAEGRNRKSAERDRRDSSAYI